MNTFKKLTLTDNGDGTATMRVDLHDGSDMSSVVPQSIDEFLGGLAEAAGAEESSEVNEFMTGMRDSMVMIPNEASEA